MNDLSENISGTFKLHHGQSQLDCKCGWWCLPALGPLIMEHDWYYWMRRNKESVITSWWLSTVFFWLWFVCQIKAEHGTCWQTRKIFYSICISFCLILLSCAIFADPLAPVSPTLFQKSYLTALILMTTVCSAGSSFFSLGYVGGSMAKSNL